MAQLTIIKSKKNGRFYPRIKSRNGKILPETDGYTSARDARRGMEAMWKALHNNQIQQAEVIHG